MLTTPQVQPWCLRLRFSRQACEVIPYLRSFPSSRRVGSPAHNVNGTWVLPPSLVRVFYRGDPRGRPAEAIPVYSIFGGCDILALATHGRSGVQRWVLGSVTERVLGHTKLPLLIVRPQQERLTSMVSAPEPGEIEAR